MLLRLLYSSNSRWELLKAYVLVVQLRMRFDFTAILSLSLSFLNNPAFPSLRFPVDNYQKAPIPIKKNLAFASPGTHSFTFPLTAQFNKGIRDTKTLTISKNYRIIIAKKYRNKLQVKLSHKQENRENDVLDLEIVDGRN